MHNRLSLRYPAALGGLLLALLTGCGDSADSRVATNGGSQAPFVGTAGAKTDPQTASRPGNEPVAQVPGEVAAPADAAAPLLATTPDSLHLLSPGRVGRLRLNMTEAALLHEIPTSRRRKTTRSAEGVSYPIYFVQDPTDPSTPPLELEMLGNAEDGYRLWRVRVMNPAYRTASGVGVGTPYGVARQQYGINTVEQSDAGLVAVSDQMQMAWLLDPSSLPAKPAGTIRPGDIPTATRITGILLSR